jgi:hypothetical protein
VWRRQVRVVGFCEHCNERSGFKINDYLSDFQAIKRYFSSSTWLVCSLNRWLVVRSLVTGKFISYG